MTIRTTIIGLTGAIVISTVGIQASDYMQHGTSRFLSAIPAAEMGCPAGTVEYLIDGSRLCVDAYEASAGRECLHREPRSAADNTANLQVSGCKAVSESGVLPLRYTSFTHAEQYCAAAGKRLLTPHEWHVVARDIDMQVVSCITDQSAAGPALTGSADCATRSGVHDMVGNVWEWVDAEVVNGMYQGREVPASGFVSSVDRAGVVLATTGDPDELYDSAYAWTRAEGVQGMVRGGFYGSGSDAGRYAQNLSVSLDITTPGIGFRCVADVYN